MTEKYTIIVVYKSQRDYKDDVDITSYSEPYFFIVHGKPTDEMLNECYQFADKIRCPDLPEYKEDWNYDEWIERYKLRLAIFGHVEVVERIIAKEDVFIL